MSYRGSLGQEVTGQAPAPVEIVPLDPEDVAAAKRMAGVLRPWERQCPEDQMYVPGHGCVVVLNAGPGEFVGMKAESSAARAAKALVKPVLIGAGIYGALKLLAIV